MKKSQHCEQIYGDTTECHKCGKQWDTNDPNPPECIKKSKREIGLHWIKTIRDKFNLKSKNN